MDSDEDSMSMLSVGSNELFLRSSNGKETNEILMNPDNSVSLKSSDDVGVGQVAVSADQVRVTLQNGGSEAHGLVVERDRTTLSGGTNTTTMTLDDRGVTFEGNSPVQIHGVADGTADTDAVNRSQLDDLEDEALRGIAISMAMDSFLPDPGKKFRVNFGSAVYKGQGALGITGAGRIREDVILYFGVGSDMGFHEVGGKAGVSFQW